MEEENNQECIFINKFSDKDFNFANVVTFASKRTQIAKVPKNISDRINSTMTSVQQKMENNLSMNQYLQVVRDALLEEKERNFHRQNNVVRTLKLNGIAGYAVSSIIVISGLAILFVIIFMISKAMLS